MGIDGLRYNLCPSRPASRPGAQCTSPVLQRRNPMPRSQSSRLHRTAVAGALAGSLIVALVSCSASSADSESVNGNPVGGGTITLAMPGTSTDSLDPNINAGNAIDTMRSEQLFDNLTKLDRESNLEYSLATSMEANEDSTEWTIHLREGVTFHDGSDFGADDVIYTIKRIIAHDSTANGRSLINFIDPEQLIAVDEHTVRVGLTKPYGPFPEIWSNKYLRIVPAGFDPSAPVGTGPFVYKSFSAGNSSTFTRNADYWGGAPYADALDVVDFTDNVAAVNALQGGQVDIAYTVPLAQIASLEATPGINILDSESVQYLPIVMNASVAPFNDPAVRKAFKLIVDRGQLVNNALDGYGTVGNDWIGRYSNCGLPDVPQREQDFAQAKKLLQEAGHSDLTVTMNVTNATSGMVEAAQIFAEQAKGAGVTVDVKVIDMATWSDGLAEWPLTINYWSDNYLQLTTRTLLPGGSGWETHWDNAEFQTLATAAFATSDDAARCEIEKQMREVEYEDGANIVWGFANTVNAYSDRVHGLQTDITGKAINRLTDVWVGQ
ncbi:ABC transporter substrate-binding protein [Rhodococcus koreensis]